jgi:tRNA (guanine37-N1)-methyltransferase
MRFDVFTLFPGFFASPLEASILGRARAAGLLEVFLHDIRDGARDKHRNCDDYPFGGGAGMVMKAEPLAQVLSAVLKWEFGPDEAPANPPCPIVLMSPQGRTLDAALAREWAQFPRIALVCAHYEGLDERAVQTLVTHEVSIGDYVLTGGEAPALVVMEAVSRFVPGVLGNAESAGGDSFEGGLLEGPHYTRPAVWRGMDVPPVLIGGDHGKVARWRRAQALLRTRERRPDLWEKLELSAPDRKALLEFELEFESAGGQSAGSTVELKELEEELG